MSCCSTTRTNSVSWINPGQVSLYIQADNSLSVTYPICALGELTRVLPIQPSGAQRTIHLPFIELRVIIRIIRDPQRIAIALPVSAQFVVMTGLVDRVEVSMRGRPCGSHIRTFGTDANLAIQRVGVRVVARLGVSAAGVIVGHQSCAPLAEGLADVGACARC